MAALIWLQSALSYLSLSSVDFLHVRLVLILSALCSAVAMSMVLMLHGWLAPVITTSIVVPFPCCQYGGSVTMK